MSSMKPLVLLALATFTFAMVEGHVRLDFPLARSLPLDFLDNVRTLGPCGMPKGATSMTSLEAGTRMNVTWHLAYPHQGGYKLELLDSNEKFVQSLTTPELSDQNDPAGWLTDDPTAQRHEVFLPTGVTCKGCTIRLLRQAREWSGGYTFWSCADVDIVAPKTLKDSDSLCMKHGRFDDATGNCVCERSYYGSRCQYKDECVDDTDCGNGMCVDVRATTAPRKVCMCEMGFFGPRCSKPSALAQHLEAQDLANHTQRQLLHDKLTLYWKVLPVSGEIEVVLKMKGTSFLGVGWRPRSTAQTCQNFPVLGELVLEGGEKDDEVEPKAEGVASLNHLEAEGKAEGVAEAEARAEGVAEAEAVAEDGDGNKHVRKGKEALKVEGAKIDCKQAKFEYPEKCKEQDCTYVAKWSLADDKDYVQVDIRHKAGADMWTAIGFSDNPFMPRSDLVLGYVDKGGKGVVQDMWLRSYVPPTVDESQDIKDASITLKNGYYEMSFKKKMAADNHSQDVDLKSAVHLLFPVSGGPVRGDFMGKHGETPIVTDDKIKISGNCAATSTADELESGGAVAARAQPTTDKPHQHHHEAKHKAHAEGEAEAEGEAVPEGQPDKPTAHLKSGALAKGEAEGEAIAEGEALPEEGEAVAEGAAGDIRHKAHSKNEPQAEGEALPEKEDGNNKHKKLNTQQGDSTTTSHDAYSNKKTPVDDPLEEEADPENAYADPESAHGGAVPRLLQKRHKFTPRGSIHAMDCTDVVIGLARGSVSKVYDAYTRDRSTPQPDEFYGGKDDLTAAVGYEKDGETTIAFRRKLDAHEETDYAITDADLMQVIWAFGQEQGMYSHVPHSGLEKGTPSIQDFYRDDELKYHGKANRGLTYINFIGKPAASSSSSKRKNRSNCGQEFRSPESCADGDCEYVASWKRLDDKEVEFEVRHKVAEGKWTAIGFSENPFMPRSDLVLGYFDANNKPVVEDMWIRSYATPTVDASQDIKDATLTRENGVNILKFKKTVNSGDEQDVNFDNALHLLYPASGGTVAGKVFEKHSETPIVSEAKLVIKKCEAKDQMESGADAKADNPYAAYAKKAAEEKSRVERMIFSCTSSSNKKLKQGAVTFEDCPMSHADFDPSSGVFSSRDAGLYSFALTSLMKSEQNSPVTIAMTMESGMSGNKHIVMKRSLGMTNSQDTELDIGVSNAFITPLEMQAGNKLMFEIVADTNGSSGLLNSDSQILKVTGYKMETGQPSLSCHLKDNGQAKLGIENCAVKEGFAAALDVEGEDGGNGNEISIPQDGHYKVAVGGGVFIGKNGLVKLALLQENKDMVPVASAVASTTLGDSNANIEIPIGFMTYQKFSAGDKVHASITSARRQGQLSPLLSGGVVAMERLADGASYVSCTNDGTISDSTIGYTFCAASAEAMRAAMDMENGTFTAPEDAAFEVSFSGRLKSSGGGRVWATLYKLGKEDHDRSLATISGASFLGMFAEDKRSGKRVLADLTATTTLVSVERLKEGDRVFMGLGRWNPENEILGDSMKTVVFNIRKL